MNYGNRICRICLLTEDSSRSLTDDEQLSNRVNLVFSFKIQKVSAPGLVTNLICNICENDLSAALELRKRIVQSEKFFSRFEQSNSFAEPEVEVKVENPSIKSEPVDDNLQEEHLDNQFFYDGGQYGDFDSAGEDEMPSGSPKKRRKRRKNKDDTGEETSERAFCSKCMKSYKTLKYLKVHEKLVHATEKFVCDFCGYKCKTKRSIKYHVIDAHSSTPKDKFICRTCGVAVSSKGNLYNHEKTHIEVDPSDYVNCNFCQKSFKDIRLLQNHVQIVHQKLKAVQCDQCSHVSTCQGSLNKHIRTVHQKIRNYTCSECPASFYQKSELDRHFRTHTGERPFPCTFAGCQRTYPSNKGRKQHMQVCPLRPITVISQ